MTAPPSQPSVTPLGDLGVRIALGSGPNVLDPLDVARRLGAARLAGVEDILPAAQTVMLSLTESADPADVGRQVSALLRQPAPADEAAGEGDDRPGNRLGDVVEIPVRYDGTDLDEAAELAGLSRADLVASHTGRTWTCRFIGFAPGFGYLASDEEGPTLPRRERSRRSIPAGSVALADRYSAVYPRDSPGGWQIIGTTSSVLWDLDRADPALLTPGTTVRFREER